MKKTLHSFYLLLLMCAGLPAGAQISMQAANDSIYIAVGNPQIVIANVLANDLLFEYDQGSNTYTPTPVTLPNATLTQLSTENPALQLQPDGSVAIASTLPAGVYSLTYEVCAVPDFCGTATVSVFISTCQAPTPYAGYVNPIYCNGTATMLIGNLPSGNWILRKTKDNVFLADITGQGPLASIVIDSPGNYGFQVIDDGNGCMSLKSYSEVTSAPCSFNVIYASSAYQDFNANGLVDAGDTVNYVFRLTNNSGVAFNTIAMASANVNISGGPLALLPNNSSNSNTFTGVHVITQQDIDAGQAYTGVTATSVNPATTDYAYNTFQLNNTRGFRLIAFVDGDGDGIKQANEPILPYAQFRYEKNNDGNPHFLFNGNAVLYENNAANSYDFDCLLSGSYTGYYTLNTPPVQNATAGAGLTTYYFALTETPFTDTCVSLVASQSAVAGFAYNNYIRYSNASSQTIPNGTLTFAKPGAIPINSVSEPGTVPNANGFTFNFTNLGPFETRWIQVNMTIPAIPAVTLGDQITHSVSLSVPAGDMAPTNNSASYDATIVGSYDPNDKTESHNGKIVHQDFTPDDFLTYVIRFENTGTANALNIKITDVLDGSLDETSARIIGSSAPCVMERFNQTLTWRFDGINLPPSVEGTETGHGYVAFAVRPKTGFAVGDIIPNTADIYFDFNPAIVTNTFETEFVETLSINEFGATKVTAYPNPVTDLLNIDANGKQIKSIMVVDLLGKTVFSQIANAVQAQVDLSTLSNGLYLVKVDTGNQTQVFKIAKK